MRRHWMVATALAATLLAGLFVAPAAPAATAEPFGMERKSYIVKTRVGKIYVEVVHPTRDGKIVRAPAVFTYSPYWALGVSENFRRARDAGEWVPDGYVRVWADVVGTGNSGGCYDYGGDREKKSGYDLVEWIAKQKWSTGKVGMFGGSYEGTTATAAAVTAPDGLATIVPEVAISRWYDYAYSGGMRYFLNNEKPADEGFDTPAAFDFGLAVPPPVDVANEDWAGRFTENVTPCDEISHTEHGYDDTPDYDKFWVERDYLKDADKIEIPVLVAHNWGDWNVKQEEAWNLYHALDNSSKRVLYMGHRYLGHGTPEGRYEKVRKQWMDHYLKGVDNGIDQLPSIVSEGADYDGALKHLSAPSSFKTRNVKLYAQSTGRSNPNDYEYKLLPDKPFVTALSEDPSFLATGINTESHANHHYTNNHDWLWVQTPPLKQDTRIFGEIKLKIRVSSAEREWITITPGIVDVDPDCHEIIANQHNTKPECLPRSVQSVTRGFMDSRYRNSLAKQDLVAPGAPIDMTIEAKPIDYTFRKGHIIGLNIATEINEWALPKHYPCTSADCLRVKVHLMNGNTQLFLPIVDAPRDTRDLFDAGHGAHH
ncbi:MAG: CocE/NonD family hydrolase [Actinomycetota bacterium]